MSTTVDERESRETSTEPERSINWPVLVGSGCVVVGLALWALIDPPGAGDVIGTVVAKVTQWFGWWYYLLAAALIAFVLYVCLSRFGKMRLGPEESRPEYSLFTWTAMLFAAGIGTDVMFYSIAEPVAQYYGPPRGGGETREAAEQAVVWTLFHYGISGWAMYAVMGMTLGFLAFRKGLPLSIRAALYPIFGRRVHGRYGDAIDFAAILGTVFGIATSLGIGIVMLQVGLNEIFGIEPGKGAQIGLIVVSVCMATMSAVSGVDKGIRRISELNVLLTIAIMLFVLFSGETTFLLNGLVQNLGDYVVQLPGMSMDTMAYDNPSLWMSYWTLFFWAWWVAWAPFVGLFLARVSRGRTIRQFLVGVLAIPFTFILLWMSVMGNSALAFIRDGHEAFGQSALSDAGAGFYNFLDHYPGAPVLIFLATLTGFLYYVTSADSGALVLGNFSSKISDPMADCHWGLRVFWSMVIGLLTIAMLFAGDGGITTLTNATIIMGIPFSIVLALVAWGLWKALRAEAVKEDIMMRALPGALSSGRSSGDNEHVSVASRVRRALTFPDAAAIETFVRGPVSEGLANVAAELREHGESVEVETVDEPVRRADGVDESHLLPVAYLRVTGAEGPTFKYAVRPLLVHAASFIGRAQRQEENYYRAEVYLVDGNQGYSVNGFSAHQVAGDVLDQFERHLTYLHSAQHP